jgi:hypothetical protein
VVLPEETYWLDLQDFPDQEDRITQQGKTPQTPLLITHLKLLPVAIFLFLHEERREAPHRFLMLGSRFILSANPST